MFDAHRLDAHMQARCTQFSLWRTCATQWPWIHTTAFLQLYAFSQWVCLYRDIPETHQRQMEGKILFSPCGWDLCSTTILFIVSSRVGVKTDVHLLHKESWWTVETVAEWIYGVSDFEKVQTTQNSEEGAEISLADLYINVHIHFNIFLIKYFKGLRAHPSVIFYGYFTFSDTVLCRIKTYPW